MTLTGDMGDPAPPILVAELKGERGLPGLQGLDGMDGLHGLPGNLTRYDFFYLF